MKRNLEVIFDTEPNVGCGCNCGCAGSNVVEEMNQLVETLKQYKFDTELEIDVLPISTFESKTLIEKINTLLGNTNASFRMDQDNKDLVLSELLPLVTLDGDILTAYGVPTVKEIVDGVHKSS